MLDIALIYDTYLKQDAEILTQLLKNEAFFVTTAEMSSITKTMIMEMHNNGASATILLIQSYPTTETISILLSTIQQDTNNVLTLVRTSSTTNSKSQVTNFNSIEYCSITNNDDIVRSINTLLNSAGVIQRSNINIPATQLQSKTVEVYSDLSFADEYYEKWGNSTPRERIDRFLSYLPKGGKVLDAGCGPGHHSHYMADLGFEIVGIDLSPAALAHARAKCHRKTQFLQADMLNSQLPAKAFDGIWSCASATHVPIQLFGRLVGEFARLLDKEGLLAMTLSIGERAHFDKYGRFFESFPNIHFAKNLLTTGGFHIIDTIDDITWNSTQGDLRAINWVSMYSRRKK